MPVRMHTEPSGRRTIQRAFSTRSPLQRAIERRLRQGQGLAAAGRAARRRSPTPQAAPACARSPCWRSASGLNPRMIPSSSHTTMPSPLWRKMARSRSRSCSACSRASISVVRSLNTMATWLTFPRRVEEREEGGGDGHSASLRDRDLRELARVVPDGADGDRLARERAMDEVEHAVALRDLVLEDVVFGRRLGAEEVAEGLVDEQAVAARLVDLQADGRAGEDALEQRERIGRPGPGARGSRREASSLRSSSSGPAANTIT